LAEHRERNVRDVTRELMRSLGLTTVFGNPGSTELGFLADWPDDFRYVLALQELCAISMADAYAQYSGNAALVNLHSIGGVGHAMGGLATAFRNHSPVVVLSGQQSRELLTGEPYLGSIEATNFVKPYVKWATEPARAADVPAAILRAYLTSTQAPYGPTLVSVPADDWDEVGEAVALRPRIGGSAPDPEQLAALVSALAASQRPALVVGGAVDADGAADLAVELAEKLSTPVWTSPMSGRCSFPEEHDLFAGFLDPIRRNLAAALSAYDLVVVIGAPAFIQHVVTADPGPALPPVYLLSDNEAELSWAPEAIGIRSSPTLALRALLDATVPAERASVAVRSRPEPPAATDPMTAAYALSVIADVLPADAVVVEEVPSHRPVMHEYLPIRRPGGFLTGQSGVLGFALSGAVGVALAAPSRPVLALVGDGSSMYSIQGLWTAVREQADVTFVILDNSQYGALRLLADAAGFSKVPGMELGGIDHCAVANGFGCPAELVTDPARLAPALRNALAAHGPHLVHVRVAVDSKPLY
jgi:benzoylformate decarboxylase